jgi:hypothetical protein
MTGSHFSTSIIPSRALRNYRGLRIGCAKLRWTQIIEDHGVAVLILSFARASMDYREIEVQHSVLPEKAPSHV